MSDKVDQMSSLPEIAGLESALESLDEALIILDKTGRIKWANGPARRLFSFTTDDLMGRPFAEISPSTDIPSTPEALLNRSPGGLRDIDVNVQGPTGLLVPLRISSHVIRNKSGRITGLVIAARGVTERHQAERRIAVQFAVTRVFAETAAVEAAGPRILKAICEGLEFDTGAIWLREGEVLRCAHSLSRNSQTEDFERISRELTFRIGEGIPGWVWSKGRSIWLADAQHESEVVLRPDLAATGLHTAVAVPLKPGEAMLGVMEFFSQAKREPDPLLIDVLTLIGTQVGEFIERRRAEEERGQLLMRLYTREHEIAETLQRSLLPERLPDIPGVQLAARYLPGAAAAVGGDWYDVIQLPGGRIGIVMGDVAGSGVRAAAVMGQMRNAMRAYATENLSPADVATRLNQLIDLGEMVTLIYLVYDPASQVLRYVNAGHLPPLVLRPDGRAQRIEGIGSPPLGGVLSAAYVNESIELSSGSTVLVYTDGLVEQKGEGIDRGLEQLEAAAERWSEGDPDMLVEQVLAALLRERGPADDVALLAMHITAFDETLQLRVRAEPSAVSDIRRAVQRWLEAQGAGAVDIFDFAVGVSEAAGNAVEHAYGAADAEIEVTAERHGTECVVSIRDWGRWRPARGSYRGRGLSIMEKMMDAVEVHPSEGGTTVILRRRIGRH